MILDKQKILQLDDIHSLDLSLELGCGPNKESSDSIGIDILDYDDVDIVGDALEALKQFPDASVQSIFSSHFFEHVDNFHNLLKECERVIKFNGQIKITVPHWSNPYFFSDYTHKTFFGLYTFSYLCNDKIFKRQVPRYEDPLDLNIENVILNFRSQRPFYIRHAFGKLLTIVVNSNHFIKELYEGNLCNLFSCNEIIFFLKKTNK